MFLFRNDFSIEIWSLANAPFLERTIPGSIEHTVEVICWAGERLFSVGLSGDGVKEWDLKTLAPKRRLLLTGEKGISMDYHKGTEALAIGTEEGIINIFDVSDNDLQFNRVLDRQDHRVICCKFNDSGDRLVSGSLDAVKVWNVHNGHVVHRMSTGRTDPNQETIVWCIDILNDFTIISGDSRGKVTFWDGKIGSQIDFVHASVADIMCLDVSEDRKSFFCSGVEQIVKKYASIKIAKAGREIEQWIRCAKRSKIHTHDVLALLAIGNELLISGGIDGFLSFSTQDLKHFERAGPFLKRPFAESAEESRLILMKYVNYLEVWKLADGAELEDDDSKYIGDDDSVFSAEEDGPQVVTLAKKTNPLYHLDVHPEKLLELRSKNDETVVCCSISNDGHWIAYSTMNAIRLFRFDTQKNSKPSVKLIRATPGSLKLCLNMIFAKDSSSLITLNGEGQCAVFSLTIDAIEHRETFNISEHHTDSIHLMTISTCSTFLVLAGLCNTITVWNLQRNKWVHSNTLPKYAKPATSLNIRRDQPLLVVSFSDNKLIEYNIDGNFIQFTAMIPSRTVNVDNAITDVCLDPRNQDSIIFCQANAINVLLKNTEKESSKKAKLAHAQGASYTVNVAKSFSTVSSTEPCLHSI